MAWPRQDEYHAAVQHPETCFDDNDLKHGKVETDALGLPKAYSGGFTTTYKIASKNAVYAVRCFTRGLKNLQSRYQAIHAFLDRTSCKFLVEAKYLLSGIRIKGACHPVIKMTWVEGDLFNVYIKKVILGGQYVLLKEFAETFRACISMLEKEGIAHGDLQHGNIVIKNGEIVLIDYDGMYLPALQGASSGEIGHYNYQHPKRTAACFDQTLDRFSSIVIYTALLALTENPKLWKKYDDGENILFKKDDFADPCHSELFYDLTQIKELEEYAQRLASVSIGRFQDIPTLENFIQGSFAYTKVAIAKPKKSAQTLTSEGQLVMERLYGPSIKNPSVSGASHYQSSGSFTQSSQQVAKQSHVPTSTSTKKGSNAGLWVVAVIVGLILLGLILGQNDSSTTSPSASTGLTNGANSTPTESLINPSAIPSPSSNADSNALEKKCEQDKGTYARLVGYVCTCFDGYKESSKNGKCILKDQYCKESDEFSRYNSIMDDCSNCQIGYKKDAISNCVIDCKQDECVYNGKCVTKPKNSYCTIGNSQGWACYKDYQQVGNKCNVIEANNGCTSENPFRLDSADWYGCFAACPLASYPTQDGNSIFLQTTAVGNSCQCNPGYQARYDNQFKTWQCIKLAK